MSPPDSPDARRQPGKATSRRQSGHARSDLVVSSHVGENAPLFAQILGLHVDRGSTVADVTYGKGAFWRTVPEGDYTVLATDIQTGVDCRDLPYEDGSIDCVVLDPPYMEGLYRVNAQHLAGQGSHGAFRDRYSDGSATAYPEGGPKYHDKVIEMYRESAEEAWRVLRNYGVFIVKCQDEVSANRQRLTHVELINLFEDRFYCKDLFVLTRANRPGVSRVVAQEHARKNHSYFLVFIKRDPAHPRRIRAARR